MLAVSVTDEKALVPPTVVITAYVPAVPLVLSQAPKVTVAVPFQLPVGTKRRLSAASSSKPLPELPPLKSTAVQEPEASLYCHTPLLLSTAVTYTASKAVVSTSVTEALTTMVAMVVPVLLASRTSSMMLVSAGLCAASSTGASLMAVTLVVSVTALLLLL